ncbi:GntR family transcriptional regulator [Mesorhizobium sp. CAU 1741]|uniref:GntR family transcriptional regulator n=1 Tax=Mesorhizobium sp. CAU 1741 TaxID=3140366 RepID=UPI00325ADDBB
MIGGGAEAMRHGPGAGPVVQHLVDDLRRAISLGEFRPSRKLKIEELRRHFGVSAISVREALSILTGEGYVSAFPQRGFFVSAYSLETLRDMTRVRGEMESVGLRWSMRNATRDWRATVAGAYHALNEAEKLVREDRAVHGVEWDSRNRDFHLALCAGCGSPTLLEQVQSFYDLTRRYRLASLTDTGTPRADSMREHQEIFSLVLEGEAEKAEETLRQHIWRATSDI